MVEASNFRRALHQNLEKKRLRLEMRRSIMMKIQENKMAEDCEKSKPTTVTTKVQNMVIESTNNKKVNDGKIKDLGHAMFCRRKEHFGLE
ncbi:unnamed protein product [Allacma fusca]|nr:unnamed protein product [Allacma fusca]